MADKKITQLTNITGANLVDADEFVVVDISADETKAITLGELKEAFDSGSGFVRITGDTMTGDLGLSGADITFGDNDKAIFGAGSDLQIYSDGANSIIHETDGNGNLIVRASNINLQNSGGTATLAQFIDGGKSSLRYNTVEKLATTSTGIDVTGDVGATTATITGKTTTDELDLNAIAATISDTAVDIFVYDTRKDSDGGAWRKRTQGTSWYNETLNTATRGSRKEFPAVAVIVAESTQVTIYDGDDPDLPMWMVFNTSSSAPYPIAGRNTITSIVSLNASLNIGGGDALMVINFITDSGRGHRDTASASDINGPWQGVIAERNELRSHTKTGDMLLVNDSCNDVAMTVLPNAPIDAATGLPVPTIAVATDGGVSVIKDDGTVVDVVITGATYKGAGKITFDEDNHIWASVQQSGSDQSYFQLVTFDVPNSDLSGAYWTSLLASGVYAYAYSSYYADRPALSALSWPNSDISDVVSGSAVSGNAGLTHLSEDPVTPANGMVAYATSTYNTGWMNGDIKLATLSDTDATNVTGSDLVVNGDFASATGWNVTSPWVISGGTASIDGSQTDYVSLDQDTLSLDQTKTYVITFDVTRTAGSLFIRFGSKNSSGNLTTISASGSYVLTSVPLGGGLNTIQFLANSAFAGTVDNVTLRLAEEDRSVNGNGLQVFGTVTKNPVATGADLVAYGGFGTGKVLLQPYNSDLNFGSGDYFITCWANIDNNSSSSAEYWLARGYLTSGWSNHSFYLRQNVTTSYVEFGVTENAFASRDLVASTVAVGFNRWTQVGVVKRGSALELYFDGALQNTASITRGHTNTQNAPLIVGSAFPEGGDNIDGSIALLRISATAPSPEQIKKIYEDEKVLFQENAQATLYGDSDAVTALAYDDTTELLHVGTSAGRSVFQGLKRVDNTTTAVGAAISASNGLVADE